MICSIPSFNRWMERIGLRMSDTATGWQRKAPGSAPLLEKRQPGAGRSPTIPFKPLRTERRRGWRGDP